MSKRINKIVALIMAVVMSMSCVSVFATSSSKSTSNSKLGATLTSNVWIQSISDFDGGGEFQVSAVYSSTNKSYQKPNSIKTAWDFYAIGIGAGVEYKKVSASVSGHGYSSTSSGSWTNSNGAKTASWRGRVYGTGLCLYVGLYNTATVNIAGVNMSTTAKV